MRPKAGGYLSVISWNGDFRESGLWSLSSSEKKKKKPK